MVLTAATASASPNRLPLIRIIEGEAVPPTRFLGDKGTAIGRGIGNIIGVPASATGIGTGPVPQAELDFWLQRQDFLTIPVLAPYLGEFVASHFGRIVDHDPSLEVLTDRFFDRFGDVPVYITKIGGDEEELRIDTPFFD